MSDKPEGWIEDVELEDIQVLWGWSDFAGKGDDFREAGKPSFQIILDEREALRLRDIGWNVREREGMEEGDPPRYTLEAKLSWRFDPPRIYFIKGSRKIAVDEQRDLRDIRRDTCERIDVILRPSRWVNGNRTGITAYVTEMYVTIRESRFGEKYADYEEV